MTLHSVGRMLQTVGGSQLHVGSNPLVDESDRPNLCPPYSEWALSGGAEITAEGYLNLPVLNAKAISPLMMTNRSEWVTLSTQIYSESASPILDGGYPSGTGGRLYNASYFAADGVSPAYTTIGNYPANGNARGFPLSEWTNRSTHAGWNIGLGEQIVYVRWTISVDSNYSSQSLILREPMTIALTNIYEPYTHHYRKGLDAA